MPEQIDSAYHGVICGTGLLPARPETPEEFEQRFRNSIEIYRRLRKAYVGKRLRWRDLQIQLRQCIILDRNNNIWWTVGSRTGNWHRSQDGVWVVAPPPVADLPSIEPLPTGLMYLPITDWLFLESWKELWIAIKRRIAHYLRVRYVTLRYRTLNSRYQRVNRR